MPRRVADGRYRIWEVGGERAALAGYTDAGAHGARVGPVWTPVARRGRGYGTALVAALSRELLAAGAPRLFLADRRRQPDVERDLRTDRLPAAHRPLPFRLRRANGGGRLMTSPVSAPGSGR